MQGYVDLKAVGVFEKGVYTTQTADGRKINKDGYEAIWEHVHHNEKIQYPTPRYREPIIMNPTAFDWRPASDTEGVEGLELGAFGERGPSARIVRIAPGATYSGSAHAGVTLLFVKSGVAHYEGRSFPPRSAFELAPNEQAEFSGEGDEPLEILVLNMPVFS